MHRATDIFKKSKIFWLIAVAVLFLTIYALMKVSDSRNNEKQFVISPYPHGLNFGFSIIDDTDTTIGPDVAPIYELLFDLGFKTTKTIWVFDPKRSNSYRKENENTENVRDWGVSIENEEYLKFVLDLKQKGFEIALHGVSSGNDTRNEIIKGYEKFNKIFGGYPSIDILHAKNIENLYSGYDKIDNPILKLAEKIFHNSDYQGHIPQSDYFWGDICEKYIKYVRLPFHAIKEVNLLKVYPTLIFHDPKRGYVNYWFPNSDGSDYQDFIRLIDPKNIKKLDKERGTTIIYTHFAKGFTIKTGENYFVKERFIQRMNDIAMLEGWFQPANVILDRFLQLRDIELIETENAVFITNFSTTNFEGMTLLTKGGQNLFDENNIKLMPNDEDEIIVGDLKGKTSKKLLKNINNENKTFYHDVNVNRITRLIIELKNYIGEFFYR